MSPCPAKPEAGMALLLCLLFLTALTLLGLSATADTVLQHQLTANLQESERAKQSALAALSWAENWLLTMPGPAPETCLSPCNGFAIHPAGNLLPHPEFESLSWWQAQGFEAGIDPLTGERLVSFSALSINPPMWIVEVVHQTPASVDDTEANPANAQVWYRILVRGSGRTDTAISVVESVVTRSWPAGAELPNEGIGTPAGGRVSWRELR